jgi:hypothetical protein
MEKLTRFVAYVASLLVIAGFVTFAVDQLQTASQRSQDEIEGVNAARPSADQERSREKQHTTVREWVDDANDVLLSPVAWVSNGSSNVWVKRGVPALLALALYGFGLGMLARFSHGTPHRHYPGATPA